MKYENKIGETIPVILNVLLCIFIYVHVHIIVME